MTIPKSILCIDDNISNGELFRRMLSREGYDVIITGSGERGLDYAKARHFDLILCDINLPGMTGFQVLKMLRSLPATENMPIIAVTANCINASRRTCMDAGFNGYINKPIMRNELKNLVAQFLDAPA